MLPSTEMNVRFMMQEYHPDKGCLHSLWFLENIGGLFERLISWERKYYQPCWIDNKPKGTFPSSQGGLFNNGWTQTSLSPPHLFQIKAFGGNILNRILYIFKINQKKYSKIFSSLGFLLGRWVLSLADWVRTALTVYSRNFQNMVYRNLTL